MPEARHIERSDGLFVLVGTSKGLFVYAADPAGESSERAPIRFAEGGEVALKRVWQIATPAGEPDTLYAGVEPAALFVSRDAGTSWELCQGLFDHPHRPKWQPGGGGLCLHTVVPHGGRLFCAISAAGVYRSDDG